MQVRFAVLRGICQTPAYVAHELGLFADAGLQSSLTVAATAWQAPAQLASRACEFAVMPWTRVACAARDEAPLVVCCGSGVEEAAIVVRHGLDPGAVRRVAVPREGGMKDLTALGLTDSLGWHDVDFLRMPSGDGAILALIGQAVDAAAMVEPYATMMEALGIGRVVKRTGDVWPGAPGCSLASRADCDHALQAAVVEVYVHAIARVHAQPDEAAEIAARYIGMRADWIRQALRVNRPDAEAVRNQRAIDAVLGVMARHGYLERPPADYLDLRALDALQLRRASVA
ncbi:MAG: ABC transporter substrate-binding protein [Deltaproteobacteria bacterium]|nr:ABC transporter substrate-binding protein [Deltaproteobacteria bacterium]